MKNKNPVVKALLDNSIGILLAILGLLLPGFETHSIEDISVQYFFEKGSSLNIDEVMKLPAHAWQSSRTRSWLETASNPAATWTKITFKDNAGEASQDLVAVNNHPMHRALNYYLTEHDKTVNRTEPQADPLQRHFNQASTLAFTLHSGRDTTLYLSSKILGNTAPMPRIFQATQFVEEQKRVNVFVGFVIGSAIAVLLFNVLTGIILKENLQIIFGIYFLAVSYLSTSASGIMDRIHPWLMYDLNMHSLFSSWAVVTALICTTAFRAKSNVYTHQTSILDIKNSKNYIIAFVFLNFTLIFLGPSTRPLLLSVILVATMVNELVIAYRDQDSAVSRLISLGHSCGFLATIVSVLAWYEIIDPNIIRVLFFEVGSLTGCFFYTSIPALKSAGLARDNAQILRQLRTQHVTDIVDLESRELASNLQQTEHQIVTMFIDIAAFSQLAAPLPSESVFEALSERLNGIAEIVREFGGSIDRSLGDGLLCFFGYRSEHSAAFNTQRAFLAARKIQESTISQVLGRLDQGQSKLIMPVRIGIHSSQMIIGNLGGQTRIDFTMIGAGVNFASRLETACTPFKVMFSDVCFKHLIELGYHEGEFASVAIHIKHKSELVTAYEFDPFRQRLAELRLACS
jgi:class 3 adenylate cyclase